MYEPSDSPCAKSSSFIEYDYGQHDYSVLSFREQIYNPAVWSDGGPPEGRLASVTQAEVYSYEARAADNACHRCGED